jgi:two-component system response regulator PrrA
VGIWISGRTDGGLGWVQVVVVDGGPRGGTWLAEAMAGSGFDVRSCCSLDDLPATVGEWSPAVVVADLSAQDLDHPSIRTIASLGARLVVVGPGRGETDVVDVLAAGADAYIAVPVGRHELAARLRAVARRPIVVPASVDPTLLQVGAVTLDRPGRQARVDGMPIALARREFDILEMLMVVAPDIVTRSELLKRLWGVGADGGTLDVHVRRLRACLEAKEGWRRIDTVRGIGFRMRDDEGPVDRPATHQAGPEPDPDPGDCRDDHDASAPVLTIGPLALHRDERRVHIGDNPVTMPRREFEILEMLMVAGGRTVTRDELVAELWSTTSQVRTLDVHLRRLRARLEVHGHERLVQTVRGIGFRVARPGSSVRRANFTSATPTVNGGFGRSREGVFS